MKDKRTESSKAFDRAMLYACTDWIIMILLAFLFVALATRAEIHAHMDWSSNTHVVNVGR